VVGVLAAALASACLFDGAQTKGLPCTHDDQCGIGQGCEGGVCGGLDPCTAGMPICTDGFTLGTCEQGTPAEVSCLDVCAANGLGESLGCEASPADGQHGCYCDPSSGFCSLEGEIQCWDTDDARICQAGVWQHADCDWACEIDGLGSGNGCGMNDQGELVCFCTSPCVDGHQYCLDGDTLAICASGTWSQSQCADEYCEGGVSLGCGFLGPIGDETCLCAV
jgi:hypothetical protein